MVLCQMWIRNGRHCAYSIGTNYNWKIITANIVPIFHDLVILVKKTLTMAGLRSNIVELRLFMVTSLFAI